MRSARQPLDRHDGLIWVPVLLEGENGLRWAAEFVLDTGTSNTVLSVQLAEFLGLSESKRLGRAIFDTPDGPVEGYTVRIPGVSFLGREVRDCLVGCKMFYSRLDVQGILGVDFFEETDLLLSFRRSSLHLAW